MADWGAGDAWIVAEDADDSQMGSKGGYGLSESM